MRHRFHSICPYFAMFPEAFVEKHLAATKYDGVVFDPFCGRGTTVFEGLIRGRRSAGCDIHPVAVCISGAKSDPPTWTEAVNRIAVLRQGFDPTVSADLPCDLEEFFDLCFDTLTYRQVVYMRERLRWQADRTDRFLAALCLGALHGESHRSPNYFSNRMPRTISTKPGYSVRWWRRHDYVPPPRDVFDILERVLAYRFRTAPPKSSGEVQLSDARHVHIAFPRLVGEVTDVITSPPYLDTTNYREDQWLRLWFLGEKATASQPRDDGRHYAPTSYWRFLEEAWAGLAPLLATRARIVVRIGGRRLSKLDMLEGLYETLSVGLGRPVDLVDEGLTTPVKRTQANSFRGSKASATDEHDFCFQVKS